MRAPNGQYRSKSPCSCGNYCRDNTTHRCVTCTRGRKQAAYNRTLVNDNPKPNVKFDFEARERRWANEDHQDLMKAERLGGMV